MDKISPQQRSWQMSRVGRADTAPEMAVRRIAYALGYRYRLHDRRLPGSPDLVFRSRKKVIFVHGCFWHRHEGCRRTTMPKTREDFWKAKFDANQARDCRDLEALNALGWKVLTIWECEIKPGVELAGRIRVFLEDDVRQNPVNLDA